MTPTASKKIYNGSKAPQAELGSEVIGKRNLKVSTTILIDSKTQRLIASNAPQAELGSEVNFVS